MSSEKLRLVDLQQRGQVFSSRVDDVIVVEEKMNNLGKVAEIDTMLANENNWQDYKLLASLNKKKTLLLGKQQKVATLRTMYTDLSELVDIAVADNDESMIVVLKKELDDFEKRLEQTEVTLLFSNEHDSSNAFLTIKPGAGGTEAQDWAQMLQRMYTKWTESRGYTTKIVDYTVGEEAGIKTATLFVQGEYAYGYCRYEHGIHRLVRRSPFDSNNRRHTSFASVSVIPELDDKIEVDINPADLRIDVYRASGAGGQHVNRTESAVRITHIPTGVVTQCQNDRSQHKNKSTAMKQLQSQLFALEKKKQEEKNNQVFETQDDIAWGHQIRSYVLDQSRVKDIRTGIEVGNPGAVLDGDLDKFISAGLKYLLLDTITENENKKD